MSGKSETEMYTMSGDSGDTGDTGDSIVWKQVVIQNIVKWMSETEIYKRYTESRKTVL